MNQSTALFVGMIVGILVYYLAKKVLIWSMSATEDEEEE